MLTRDSLVIERPHPVGDGVQKIYRFDNNYGASVIRNSIGGIGASYGYEDGLWELGVIQFYSKDNDDYSLTYLTPITDDVLGHLTEENVNNILQRISEL